MISFVALNKAILDFIDKHGTELTSAEQKEKLKKYFFSNLVSILAERNLYGLKKFLDSNVVHADSGKSEFYFYKNYFFKLEKNFSKFRFTAHEYDVYNKIKENANLKNNINKYYGYFDKEINGVKNRIIVSKNLQEGKFIDLYDFFYKKNKKLSKEKCADIIKKIIAIQSVLKNEKGLYNFDLKLRNIMIDEDLNIKLIDYEGIAPKDSTVFMISAELLFSEIFLVNEELKSDLLDYIQFDFIIKLLSMNAGTNMKEDARNLLLSQGQKLESQINYFNKFKKFRKNHTNYFKQNLGLNEAWFDKIENIINTGIELSQKRKFNNIVLVDDKENKELNSKLLREKSNSIYIMKDIFINEQNKLVERANYKFIEKRKEGDYFRSTSWYYNSGSFALKYESSLANFMSEMQKKGTVLQKIVDEVIPIDESSIFQKIILGTLIVKFINTEITKEGSSVKFESLYSILIKESNIEQYFGKKAFKQVFMQIIEADKTLLDSFFDFKEECELIQLDNDKFKLKFKGSNLELDLEKAEADNLIKKFHLTEADIQKKYTNPESENQKPKINSKNPIETIAFKQIGGNYENFFAIQIPVIRGKDKKILTDKKGNNIKLKLNVVYTKDSGVSYQFIGQSEQIVETLKKEGKLTEDLSELKSLADLLFIDRYCTDNIVRAKIEGGTILTQEQKKALSDYVKRDKDNEYSYFNDKLMEKGRYTFAEIEELLADTPSRTNTYVGVKDVELKVTKNLVEENKIEQEIQRLKRAGIHKVVLLKDNISDEALCSTVIKIRKLGLQPIIGITGNMLSEEKSTVYDFIEISSRLKSLAGFRFMVDINDNVKNLLQGKADDKESILELIKKSGKEISYKPSNFDNQQEMEKADKLFEGKVIFVVEGKQIIKDETGKGIEFKNEDVSNIISKLAGEGRFSLYFDMDKEDNLKMAKELVEKIFGKGAEATKTMISLGTTFTANMFAELFKKDAPTKCFSNAYELGYGTVFGEVSPEKVAGAFKELLTGSMTYSKFKEYMDKNKNEAFTENFKNFAIGEIEAEIKKDDKLKDDDKTAMLRQYVMGFLISYIEDKFNDFYETKGDIRQIDINVKKQIMYRIICLLLSGINPTTIKVKLKEALKKNTNNQSLKESVNNTKKSDLFGKISTMTAKSDSVFESEMIYANADAVPVDVYDDINILLEDSLVPIADIGETEEVDMLQVVRSIAKKA